MLKLSDEALGALMMALQKSLYEQSDIIPVLKDFEFRVSENEELFVMNPPLFKMDQKLEQEDEDPAKIDFRAPTGRVERGSGEAHD